MKSTEKIREDLSLSRVREANAKYNCTKRWKINLSAVDDYIKYMEEDNSAGTK